MKADNRSLFFNTGLNMDIMGKGQENKNGRAYRWRLELPGFSRVSECA